MDINLSILGDANQYLRRAKDSNIAVSQNDVWIPVTADNTTTYVKGSLKEITDGRATLERSDGSTQIIVEESEIQKMNPPEFYLSEDMSSMKFIQEATILDNLINRSMQHLVYTHCGAFCISVNPYKTLPIYTREVANLYESNNIKLMPPHIFGVARSTFASMIDTKDNQTIVLTGESGSGKTENVKQIIRYFSMISAVSATGINQLDWFYAG